MIKALELRDDWLGRRKGHGLPLKLDFQIQYNNSGVWEDALISEMSDQNNITLWRIDHETGAVQGPIRSERGTASGCFRDK